MRLRLTAFFTIVCLLIFFACRKENNFNSHVSFFHASLGFPPVTIKIDSANLISAAKYDTVIYGADYPSGTYHLRITVNGVTQISDTTNLDAGGRYIGLVYDSASKAKLFLQKESIPGAPGDGKCKVRIFNMLVGSESNNLQLGNDTFSRVYTNTGFFGSFTNAFAEIDTMAKPAIRLDSLHIINRLPVLHSGKVYTIYLQGSLKDTGNNTTGLYKARAILQSHN